MQRPALELAGIVRRHGAAFRRQHRLAREQLRLLRAIETCRTAALGGHVEQCGQCSHIRISYNSCRNRHCPKCQSLARARWLQQRKAELLPVPYFHVVFTVPQPLAAIAFQNKKLVYGLLFGAVSQTLLTIAADPKHLGATIGFLAILHTWGQNLLHHPHIHCLVPGGGLSPDRTRWIPCRPAFFLSVRVLSRLFRRLLLDALQRAFLNGQLRFYSDLKPLAGRQAFAKLIAHLRAIDWVVYAKPPFASPLHVLEYLGRYTHRVALSNDRLLAMDDSTVTFRWKDYRHHNRIRSMRLQADEFLRRFLLHTLPPGFQRIRHYGLLSNRHRRQCVPLCRQLLLGPAPDLLPDPQSRFRDYRAFYESLTGVSLDRCPRCGAAAMRLIQRLDPIPYHDSS